MKIEIDIDCTPEEARTFLGLPDVQPMQAAVLAEMQKRLLAGLQATEPEQLMRTWMQGALGAAGAGSGPWEQMQKAFWNQMAAASGMGSSGMGSSGMGSSGMATGRSDDDSKKE